VGLVLLALVAVGCTPSTEQPQPVTSLPHTTVSAPAVQDSNYLGQAVIANDAVGNDTQQLVDWFNSLPGKEYRGKIIYKIDSISVVKGYATTTTAFALVSLREP
jgi:hypothetical protein